MKFVITLLTFLLVGFYHVAVAQQGSIKAIAEVPIQFGVGYEGQVSRRFSVGASLGVLTSPNSNIIIGFLRAVGTDDKLVLIIEDAFQLGVVGKLNVNYNFKRNYVGAFGLVIGAQAGNVSTVLIEDYFQTSMTDYPLLNGKTNSSEDHLTVRTRLYQAGVLYGHRFPLKNDRLEIDVEFGLSANIKSISKIYSEDRDLTALSTRLDASLEKFYKSYAFIPSLGVMLVYKLKKKSGK